MRLIIEKFIKLVRRDGLWKSLKLAFNYLKPRPPRSPEAGFDELHGTDTDERVFLWNLRIDSPNAKFGTRYEASDPRVLEYALKHIGADPATLTFIDLGCGKGRMLIIAWKLGFRKVVGVEFSSELAKIAQQNLSIVGASNAGVVTADASEFSFPDEDFVAYFFNPFDVEVMRHVVENLRRARTSRRYVIYNRPCCSEIFDSSGFLTRIGNVLETQYTTAIWGTSKLYDSAPPEDQEIKKKG